jgi:hypothetical protein
MISIVIVNYKNPALLKLCLGSIFKSLLPDTKFEILVVDVASSVETRNVALEDFEGIKFLPFQRNIGYTQGVNEGLRASVGDVVLIMNSDIVPLKGSIERLANYLHENTSVGMTGPCLLNFDGSIQDSTFRFYDISTVIYRRSFLGSFNFAKKKLDTFLMKDADRNSTYSADWLMGSAYMVTRKAINMVGPMDKNFFMYMSDVDWAKRFWENGYKIIYYPDSKMYHYHRRASKGPFDIFDVLFRKESRWHLIDALRYFKKYGINTSK